MNALQNYSTDQTKQLDPSLEISKKKKKNQQSQSEKTKEMMINSTSLSQSLDNIPQNIPVLHQQVIKTKEETGDNLKSLINQTSGTAQKAFEDNLAEDLSEISGFQTLFSANNKSYSSEKNLQTPQVRNKYNLLREEDQEKFRKICTSHDKRKEIFNQRIQFLQSMISNHMFEQNLLKEILIGNSTFRLNPENFFGLDFRYGVNFRIKEIEEVLQSRKTQLGIKENKSEKDEESSIPISDVQQEVALLSGSIDALKDQVLVINKALVGDNSEEIAKGHLAQPLFDYHNKQLKALRTQIESLKIKKEERVKTLEKEMELESGTPDSEKSINAKFELAEIKKRWEMIGIRQDEVQEFLQQRKTKFSITESKTNENENGDENKKLEFSTELKQSLKLLHSLTSLKEDTVLGNNWEKLAPVEVRKIIYFQTFNKLEDLKKLQARLETERLQRNTVLMEAIAVNKSFINTLNSKLETINQQMDILKKETKERSTWQVNNAENQIAEKPPKQNSLFNFGYIFGKSETGSSPKGNEEK